MRKVLTVKSRREAHFIAFDHMPTQPAEANPSAKRATITIFSYLDFCSHFEASDLDRFYYIFKTLLLSAFIGKQGRSQLFD